MLDGALSIGDFEEGEVTWLSPMEVFEIRLRRTIREMLDGKRPGQRMAPDFEVDAKRKPIYEGN
jgi:hypothetical protein